MKRFSFLLTVLFCICALFPFEAFSEPSSLWKDERAERSSKSARLEVERAAPSGKYAEGEVLVRFAAGVTAASAESIAESAKLSVASRFETLSSAKGHVYFHLTSDAMSTEEIIALLSRNPNVDFAEPNYIYSISRTVPNDPRFGELWGLENTGQWWGETPGADIRATAAWDVQTSAPGVVVAVMDTGVYYDHEDLRANMWNGAPLGFPNHGWNFTWDGNSDDPNDVHGHGTHCSGTIGAVGNNGIGVAGVAWGVQIMAVKVLGDSGSGWGSDIVNGYNWVLARKNQGVNVAAINASFGGGGYSQTEYDAIQALGDAGVILVAAAGNDSTDNDTYAHYPSSYEVTNIIAVAASEDTDNMAWFSNYGANSVDLAAPGQDILSTTPNNGYGYKSGTSMATPHVTGAVAMAAQRYPGDTGAQRRNRILNNVDVLPAWNGLVSTGGRLNLQKIIGAAPTPPLVSDHILWQEHVSGDLCFWNMDGVNRMNAGYLNPRKIGGAWKIVGSGDFNNDKKTDILWQEMNTNHIYIWYMNGVNRIGGAYLTPNQVARAWRVVGVADFNNDKKPDILWQEINTNHLYVWYMNGVNRIGGAYLTPNQVARAWRVVGVADFNNDKKPDILWQEINTNHLYVWYMNGVNRIGGAYLTPNQVARAWRAMSLKDFNGDGKPDILWQEMNTNQLYVWYMNGVNRIGGVFLTPNRVDGAWRVAGHSGAWVSEPISRSEPSLLSVDSKTPEAGVLHLTDAIEPPEGRSSAMVISNASLEEDPVEEKRKSEEKAPPPEALTAQETYSSGSSKSSAGCASAVFPAGTLFLLPLLLLFVKK